MPTLVTLIKDRFARVISPLLMIATMMTVANGDRDVDDDDGNDPEGDDDRFSDTVLFIVARLPR